MREVLRSRFGSLIFVLTDIDILKPTYILASLFRYNKQRCSIQTAGLLIKTSVSLCRSNPFVSVFSRDMTFDQTIPRAKRAKLVNGVVIFLWLIAFPLKERF